MRLVLSLLSGLLVCLAGIALIAISQTWIALAIAAGLLVGSAAAVMSAIRRVLSEQ